MIEISGQEKKIEAFIEAVRPYGIRELARTGRIALVRGSRPSRDASDAGRRRGGRRRRADRRGTFEPLRPCASVSRSAVGGLAGLTRPSSRPVDEPSLRRPTD